MNRLPHYHNREGMVFADRDPSSAGQPDLIAGSPYLAPKHPAVRGLNGSHPRAAHQELRLLQDGIVSWISNFG